MNISKYPRIDSKIFLIPVSAILLIAFFFGMSGIGFDPIRRDESTTMGHIGVMQQDGSGYTLSQTWDSLMTYSGEHPPLYYFSANLWSDVFSDDYRILRILSIFWGILALAMIYRLSADFASPQAGIWAILILATFTFYHHYLHEIREYSALLFWSTTAWWLYMRGVTKPHTVTNLYLVILAITTASAMYTHPTSFPLFIGMGIYHLLFVPKSKQWWQIAGAIVVGGITFSLWLPGLLSGVDKYTSRLVAGEPDTLFNSDIIEGVMLFWGNGHILIFIVLCVIATFVTLRNEKGSRPALLFMVTFAIVYMLANAAFPFTKKLRYVIVFTIPFVIWVGIGLEFFSRSFRWLIIPIAVVSAWIFVGSSFYRSNTFLDAVGTIAPQTFTEYHELMPLLASNTEPDITLVNTIYNVSTMKDSKQGGMGIDEYYQSQFDIRNYNIRADASRQAVPDKAIEFVADEPEFWLNFFRTQVIGQVTDFRERVESSGFTICEEYEYGERSILVHYVKVDQINSLCHQ